MCVFIDRTRLLRNQNDASEKSGNCRLVERKFFTLTRYHGQKPSNGNQICKHHSSSKLTCVWTTYSIIYNFVFFCCSCNRWYDLFCGKPLRAVSAQKSLLDLTFLFLSGFLFKRKNSFVKWKFKIFEGFQYFDLIDIDDHAALDWDFEKFHIF